jgi:hypothetical protein
MAELIEDVLNLQDYDIVVPYVRIAENAESQRLAQTAEEGLMNEMMTPSGLTPDDYSETQIDQEAFDTSNLAEEPVA